METFAALADPVRRQIVGMLAGGELTAGEIADRFDITRPAISRHLKVLRQAGLASVRGDAQRRIYALEPAKLTELEQWAAEQRTIWERRFDKLGERLNWMAEQEKP
jgi:DNA-binding transcriptional ArsR family regulator